jgi:hypothetical protein
LDRALGRSAAGHSVNRGTTRRSVAVTSCVLAAGCFVGAGGTPSPLRGYRVLIESHDSLSDYLARALSRKGFTVRRHVRGGSPPTAALFTFTFRELGRTPAIWFEARLADTRSGAIVAAVSAPFDALGGTVATRAQSVADSFAARLVQHHKSSP